MEVKEVYWKESCLWLKRELVFYVNDNAGDQWTDFITNEAYELVRGRLKAEGLRFMFMPKILEELGYKVFRYMGGTGKIDCSVQAHSGIIPEAVLQQVKGATFIHYSPQKRTFYLASAEGWTGESEAIDFLMEVCLAFTLKKPKKEDKIELPENRCGSINLEKGRPPKKREPKTGVCASPAPKESPDIADIASSRPRFHIEADDKQELAEDEGPELNAFSASHDDVRFSISETPKEGSLAGVRFSMREPSEEELAVMADEENVKMMQEAVALLNQLEKNGISKEFLLRLMKNAQQPKGLCVNADHVRFEGDVLRDIKMGPMERTFYLFMLLHPEGIDYKDLNDNKGELLKIYRALGARGNRESQEWTITNFCDPTKNMASISASRIKRAFLAQMSEELAKPYLIQGPVGGKKAIPLDRELVHWNDETLCAVLKIKQATAGKGEGKSSNESPLQKLARKIFGKD